MGFCAKCGGRMIDANDTGSKLYKRCQCEPQNLPKADAQSVLSEVRAYIEQNRFDYVRRHRRRRSKMIIYNKDTSNPDNIEVLEHAKKPLSSHAVLGEVRAWVEMNKYSHGPFELPVVNVDDLLEFLREHLR